MLGSLMNALMQPGPQGQPSAGSDLLSSVVGGIMGGQGSGAAPVNQLLNGLQQVMQSKPGAAAASSPLMGLLGPVATAVAGKTGISPAIATTVAATAMHYLVSSHPAAGGIGATGTASIAQQLSSGSVPPAAVNSVMQSTGLSQADAQKALSATMSHFQEHAQQHAANLAAGKKRRDG